MSNHKECVGSFSKGPCGWSGNTNASRCPDCGCKVRKVAKVSDSKKLINKKEMECVGKGGNRACGWKGFYRGIVCPRCGGRIKPAQPIDIGATGPEAPEQPVDVDSAPEQPIDVDNTRPIDVDTPGENENAKPMEREIQTENP